MRRFLQRVVIALVALAFTGGASIVVAMTAAPAAESPCPKPSHDCPGASLTCGCCLEGGGSSQAPAVPASERSSLAKTLAGDGAATLVAAVVSPAPRARLLYPPATHRAGPPIALTILHAALLL